MGEETEEQTLARFQAEVQALVERFADEGKGDDVDLVLVREWSLVLGAQVIRKDGTDEWLSSYLNSPAPTWSIVGLLEQTAREIDAGEDEADDD